jgi:hypothetical protein
MGILGRLARINEVELHAMIMGQAIQRPPAQFGAVILLAPSNITRMRPVCPTLRIF